MDRDEPSGRPAAAEESDAVRKRLNGRKLVWMSAVVVLVVVPAVVVLVAWIAGPGLSPEEESVLGTWKIVDTSSNEFVAFRRDQTATSDGYPFSWSIDNDRLTVWEEPESNWARLWYQLGAKPNDLEEYRIEFTGRGVLILHEIEGSDTIELRRYNPPTVPSPE